jgi:signal transduction histidine kinase
MLMGAFILTILFLHKKKQIAHVHKLKEVEAHYERNILKTQLEIQEQTFQHISREIHDNISLSLTLAKLYLNTLDQCSQEVSSDKIKSSIDLLTKSINELSDISRGLNSNIVVQHGLVKAVEDELQRIRQAGLFEIKYFLDGDPVFMNNQRELIIFRIIQEAFNNIIRHAKATEAQLRIHYKQPHLQILVRDNGKGFEAGETNFKRHAGLKNMETRIKMLRGIMKIQSSYGTGTSLSFLIPIE